VTGLAEIEGLLPSVASAERIELEEGDVLIAAPGFEDRTFACCDYVRGEHGAAALLLDYRPENSENQMVPLSEELANLGFSKERQSSITYDRFNPGDFELRLRNALVSSGARFAVLDISTMSKLAIMLVLKTLMEIGVRTKLFYAEAGSYGPSEEEFEEAKSKKEVHRPSIQIFTGVHGVVRVNSLASVAMQGQPTAAIAFMSFNDALTQTLLNTVYPTRLFLVNGKPPKHSWREQATAWIHDQVRAEWSDDNPIDANGLGIPNRSASTLDYKETVLVLLELYWQLSSSHRILLAPAGSKFQTVGCYIVKALHPDIHIEYPSPQGFLKVYSSGVGPCWQLELGDVAALVDTLHGVETQEYLRIEEHS